MHWSVGQKPRASGAFFATGAAWRSRVADPKPATAQSVAGAQRPSMFSDCSIARSAGRTYNASIRPEDQERTMHDTPPPDEPQQPAPAARDSDLTGVAASNGAAVAGTADAGGAAAPNRHPVTVTGTG